MIDDYCGYCGLVGNYYEFYDYYGYYDYYDYIWLLVLQELVQFVLKVLFFYSSVGAFFSRNHDCDDGSGCCYHYHEAS